MYKRFREVIFRSVQSAIACAVTLTTILPSHAASTDSEQSRKYLLLDDRVVESVEGAVLMLGKVQKHPQNPLWGADRPWEVRMDNLYPNVIYDHSSKKFHCWYSPFIVDPATSDTPATLRQQETYLDALKRIGSQKREMAICYATSTDGVRWEKPELGVFRFDDSTQNNIVLRLPPQGPHGAGVFDDRHDAVPARRFKTFFSLSRGLRLAYSSDGIRWSAPSDCNGIEVPGDTHNCLLWAANINKYVGFTRTWDGVRQVARTESADLKTWTQAKVVLQGLDEQHQTYAMQVFHYADNYLALLMIFNTEPDTVHCELAWSPDTIQWHRVCPGKSFIEIGPPKSYDSGCVYASLPIIENDRIRIFYGGGNGPHGGWRDSCLCGAELPLDHWAGYLSTSSDSPGVVVTRPTKLESDKLELTAATGGGSVQTYLQDEQGHPVAESEPIRGDVTDGKVKWKQPESVERLVGRKVKLRFELRNATLYTFRWGATSNQGKP